MDMDMHMGDGADTPLSPSSVDYGNITQVQELLDQVLDDSELQIIGARYARFFWYAVIAFVAVAALFHFLRWLELQLRVRAAAERRPFPSKPTALPARWLATITAMSREATYLQYSPATNAMPLFKIPALGTILSILAYLALVLVLEFADNNVTGIQHWQALGIRAGWLAVAQVPLIVMLINKNNVIGALTGSSYERLNVIHRWSARIMLLLAIFHFAFQSTGWQRYGLLKLEWQTDDCPITGIAAFALLLWMNIASVAPLRYLSYEVFVLQHIISFFGFIIAIMMHLPSTALSSRVYIYIPIGLYLADRVIRTILLAYKNFKPSRATLLQLNGGVTKIRISNKSIRHWRPGSHILLSMPRFGFMQSHPATILSTPRSHGGDLNFILKSHRGFTKTILDNSSTSALLPDDEEAGDEAHAQVTTHLALIDGPYGSTQSDFAAFDSICLIAGSTGVTFTAAILQDLADRATHCGKRLPVRRIHFIWCIKDTSWASWVSNELSTSYNALRAAGIEVDIDIHVTCADNLTNRGPSKECPCACDKSLEPCCCVQVDEDEQGEKVDAGKKGKLPAGWSRVTSIPAGKQMPILPCAVFHSGRPQLRDVLTTLLDGAEGESGVAACGPLGLSSEVRNTIVLLSDERAIHKGTGAQGCYLHVEVGL